MNIFSKFVELIKLPEEKILNVEGLVPGVKLFESTSEYYETLNDFIDSMKLYFNCVIDHTLGVQIAAEMYPGDMIKRQENITRLDASRKIAHDAAIAKIKMLNRLCEAFDREPLCTLDVNDRTAVNAFIFAFCTEAYTMGSKHLRDFDDFLYSDMSSVVYGDSVKSLENIIKTHTIKESIDVKDLLDER